MSALWAGAHPCIGDLLDAVTLTFKSEIALIEAARHREAHQWSFRDFRAETARAAAWMHGAGVTPGDRVAILMTNQSRWLVAAAAVFRLGGIVVPLDYKLTGAEQDTLLGFAKPVLLVSEYGLVRRLQWSGTRLVVDTPAQADPVGQPWEALPDAPLPPLAVRTREDIATLVYSSGTRGTPKGCMLSHGAYLSQLEALLTLYPMTPGQRFFSILPTNHAIDFMCGFLAPFACGATVVHQRTLRPEFLRATLQRYGITHMAAVPMILESLKTAVEEGLQDQPSWKQGLVQGLVGLNRVLTEKSPRPKVSQRLLKPVLAGFGGKLELVFTGGAFVRPELAEFFYELGVGIVIGYGLTEACTVVTVNDMKPFRSDTVGKPVPGVRVRIVDSDPAGVGEVEVAGPTLMSGYDGAPELTVKAFTADGWLRTGDLGWVDASGALHLVGRRKNMIVTAGGKNLYPEDIEGLFGSVPCEEFAVFAADFVWPRHDNLGREELIAVARGCELDAVRRANRRLPDFKRVVGVLRWEDEFPRTASMKLKRSVLAESIRGQVSRDAIERF